RFKDRYITEETKPNLDELESVASPISFGYSWSKWYCEELLQHMNSKSHEEKFPIIIYRIPWTHFSSDTGFTSYSSNHLIAAMQERLKAIASIALNISPVDIICEFMLTLSRKDNRKHNLYHILNSDETRGDYDFWYWIMEAGYESNIVEDEQIYIDAVRKPESPLYS